MTFCPNCGRNLSAVKTGTGTRSLPVKDYLVESILVTLLCCMPLGIVALIYAVQSSSLSASGDSAGALEASNNASKWVNISAICGLVIWVGTILFWLIGIILAIATAN